MTMAILALTSLFFLLFPILALSKAPRPGVALLTLVGAIHNYRRWREDEVRSVIPQLPHMRSRSNLEEVRFDRHRSYLESIRHLP